MHQGQKSRVGAGLPPPRGAEPRTVVPAPGGARFRHTPLPSCPTVTREAGRGQERAHSRHRPQHSSARAGRDPHVSPRAALPAPVIGLQRSAGRCPGLRESRINPSTAPLGKAARSAPRISSLAATAKKNEKGEKKPLLLNATFLQPLCLGLSGAQRPNIAGHKDPWDL